MSIIKHVTLQKIVAHDFRYDPHIFLMDGLMDDCVSWVAALQNYVYMDLFLRRLTSLVKDKVTVDIFIEFFSLYVQSIFCALI